MFDGSYMYKHCFREILMNLISSTAHFQLKCNMESLRTVLPHCGRSWMYLLRSAFLVYEVLLCFHLREEIPLPSPPPI